MNRRRLFLAFSVILLIAGWPHLRSIAFDMTFDQNLARFPLAASIASRDPGLRTIFFQRTRKAFDQGGWRAANGALQLSLATEVEVYADDEHINAVVQAALPLLLKLEDNPPQCKSYMLAGAQADELLEARPEADRLSSIWLAAIENGFSRRTSGIGWTKPNDEQSLNIWVQVKRGPIATLTQAELEAAAEYLDGDAQLVCSGSIKESRNLLAMESREAAYAKRVLIANTGKIDIARVLSKLCREKNSGLNCS